MLQIQTLSFDEAIMKYRDLPGLSGILAELRDRMKNTHCVTITNGTYISCTPISGNSDGGRYTCKNR